MYEMYPEYRNIESEWAEVIPSHWSVGTIGQKFDIQVGKMLQSKQESDSEVQLPYLKARHIPEQGEFDFDCLPEMWFSPEDRKKYSLSEGDLLVAEGGDVGRAGIWPGSNGEVLYQNAINRIRPLEEDDSDFLYYWLSFLKSQGFIEVICNNATILHYTAETVSRTPFIIPPVREQKKISTYLDYNISRIDSLIRRKKRLLEHVQDHQESAINTIITATSEAEVSKRDVEIPWLQQLPEDWDLAPIRFLSKHVTSGPRDWADHYTADGSPFLRVTNLRPDSIDIDTDEMKYVLPPDNQEAKRATAKPGDILVAITGATICSVGRVPESIDEAYINQHVALIRPNDSVEAKWVAYCLISPLGQEQLRMPIRGGTKEGLGLNDIKNVLLPVPPVEQQQTLITEIEKETNRVSRLSEMVNQSIDIFEEKRRSLIGKAVTGQIDLRDWQLSEKQKLIS